MNRLTVLRRLTSARLPSLRRRRLILASLIALVTGSVVLFGSAAGWVILHQRDDALRAARIAAANLAYSLGDRVAAHLQAVDIVLDSLAEQQAADLQRPDAASRLPDRLRGGLGHDLRLRALAVTDTQGRALAAYPFDPLSLAPPPAAQAAGPAGIAPPDAVRMGGMALGPVVRLPDGGFALTLFRRWTAQDGQAGGFVVGAVDLDDLARSYLGLDVGSRGIVSLWRSDGTLLARMPPLAGKVGTRPPAARLALAQLSGSAGIMPDEPSWLDHTMHVWAFRRLPGIDLVQTVGLGMDDVLAGWRRDAVRIGGIAAGLMLLGGLAGLWTIFELQRRQTAEAGYGLLAQDASDMIFCLDRNLVRCYVSPACSDILGFRPQELLGRSPLDAAHPEDAPALRLAYQAVLEGADPQAISNRIRHREGHWLWVDVRLRGVRDERTGRIIGVVGSLRDATVRQTTEAALEESNRHLAALANSDGLTGIANRRYFDMQLDLELRRALRDGMPICLLMIDVDLFKKYNDRYGHLAGDACLRMVAGAVQASVGRPTDLVARYGGEELAVILPNTPLAGGRTIARRIAARLRVLAIPHDDGIAGQVTVSIGLATAAAASDDPHAAGPLDPRELVARADRALYAAKAAGRARLMIDAPAPHAAAA